MVAAVVGKRPTTEFAGSGAAIREIGFEASFAKRRFASVHQLITHRVDVGMTDDADLGFGSGTRNESRGLRDCSLGVCDRQADGDRRLLTGRHGPLLPLLARFARGFNTPDITRFTAATRDGTSAVKGTRV